MAVCHFAPVTSKWDKIEHRLFSQISINWRGRPLTSHEVVVNTIGATRTRTGLAIHAELDPGAYPTGVTVPDDVMDRLPLTPHEWHGTWDYTLRPEPLSPQRPATAVEFGRFPVGDKAPVWLAHPSLTGLEPTAWADLLERYTRYRTDHPPVVIPGRHWGGNTGTKPALHLRPATRHRPHQALVAAAGHRGHPVRGLQGEDRQGRPRNTPDLDALGHTITAGALKVTSHDQLAAISGQRPPPP